MRKDKNEKHISLAENLYWLIEILIALVGSLIFVYVVFTRESSFLLKIGAALVLLIIFSLIVAIIFSRRKNSRS